MFAILQSALFTVLFEVKFDLKSYVNSLYCEDKLIGKDNRNSGGEVRDKNI